MAESVNDTESASEVIEDTVDTVEKEVSGWIEDGLDAFAHLLFG